MDGVTRVDLHQARSGMLPTTDLGQVHAGDVVNVRSGHYLVVRQGTVQQRLPTRLYRGDDTIVMRAQANVLGGLDRKAQRRRSSVVARS